MLYRKGEGHSEREDIRLWIGIEIEVVKIRGFGWMGGEEGVDGVG